MEQIARSINQQLWDRPSSIGSDLITYLPISVGLGSWSLRLLAIKDSESLITDPEIFTVQGGLLGAFDNPLRSSFTVYMINMQTGIDYYLPFPYTDRDLTVTSLYINKHTPDPISKELTLASYSSQLA